MSIENITRRILFVEHQPEILEMAKSEIRQKGIDFVCKVVDTESAFLNELTVFQPHIVILNYVMPGFNGAKVIEILRDSHLLIPFIILTGSINEETSVFCMKAGASDYVLKEQIYRLPDAVVEAIEKSTLCLDDAKNQECLRESLEEYRGIINGMNETVWIINVDGTLLDLNDRAVEVLGYSGEELLNMGLFGIDHSMSKKDILDLVRLMPVVQNQFFQTRHTTKEGKEIPVEINSSLIKYQGRTVIMSVARDISERINREKELRTAEENLRNLAESVGGILWEFDLIEDRWTYVAPQAEKMLGFAPHEWIDSEFWIERVHPDDRLWVIDFLRQSARQGKDHVFEYRFKRKDGSYVWLRSDVIVEMKDGKPSVLKGIKTNIAARKNAEDQLQLLSHSVEQGPASIVITDVNGIIEYVNNTFSKITGYSSEEVLGITPRMFKSGKQSSLFYKALWGNILAGKEWH
jgi:PAS domain S-box-containing protein